MPVPTVYTEAIFRDYMVSVLGQMADILGWDNNTSQVVEAGNDALLELGVSNIATVTNIRGLRALGRRAIWRAVVQATTGYYAFTDVGQQQFSRQQINEQARKALELAETECLEWSPAYATSIVSVSRPHDPYAVLPDSARVP